MGRSVKYSSAVLTGLKSYSEAVNARVEAYTAESYQCPWSQRSPQFMFREFALKQYYDAANTGCCDERIRPFSSKAQYAEASAAMTPKECHRDLVAIGCSSLEAPDKAIVGCAGSDLETQFNVVCPQMCEQFRDLPGTNLSGKFGKFSLVVKTTSEDWLVRYKLNDEVRLDVFDRCLGEMTVKDIYCEYGVIETKIMASLADPDGCYCDCCGKNGRFTPPTHQWQNVSFGASSSSAIAVKPVLNTACRDGKISSGYGSWSDGLGSVGFSWVTDSMYKSDGTQHYLERIGSIGDRDHPVCCGFNFALAGSDGCGWSGTYSGSVARGVGNPSPSPAAGSVISAGYYLDFSVSGVCINSNRVGISSSRNCLTLYGDETIKKSGDRITLTTNSVFQAGHACSGCCGNGVLTISYNDGCNKTGSVNYYARKELGTGYIGHAIRCKRVYEQGKYYYRPEYTELECQGGTSYYWTQAAYGPYEKVADCVASVKNNKSFYCGRSNCDGKGCCWYADNGYSDEFFNAVVVCVNDSKCCRVTGYDYNGQWVTKGSDCCNADGSAA